MNYLSVLHYEFGQQKPMQIRHQLQENAGIYRRPLSFCSRCFSSRCGVFIPGQSDLEFCLNVDVFQMFSLFIATRWHCRLKGKHLLLFSELRKVGDLENKTVLPPWNCLWDPEMQGGFFFQFTGLHFWGSKHDICCITIIIYTKSFNWFSICKYIWAVQSCCFAPLLPLGC